MNKLIELYKTFEDKESLIVTISDFKYITKDLKVFEDRISFHDNRDRFFVIAFSEIKLISEVRR